MIKKLNLFLCKNGFWVLIKKRKNKPIFQEDAEKHKTYCKIVILRALARRIS